MKRYHNKKSYIASEKSSFLPSACFHKDAIMRYYPHHFSFADVNMLGKERKQSSIETKNGNKIINFHFPQFFSFKRWKQGNENEKVTRWILQFHVSARANHCAGFKFFTCVLGCNKEADSLARHHQEEFKQSRARHACAHPTQISE